MKSKIIKRDKFIDDYLKAYREAGINLGMNNSELEKLENYTRLIEDFRGQMKINGLNFIQNEKSYKGTEKCFICKKSIKRDAIRVTDQHVTCMKCVREIKDKLIEAI